MKKFKVGDKVKISIHDTSQTHEEIDIAINGATGIIIDINSFVYPYIIQLDDNELQQLITDCPRQFGDVELIRIYK